MKQTKVEFKNESVVAELTVQEATLLIGLRRTRMAQEQDIVIRKALKEGPLDQDEIVLRKMLYPDFIAPVVDAVVIVNGETLAWPLSFEEFAALPEELSIEWQNAVYELNPHWIPKLSEDAEKKA